MSKERNLHLAYQPSIGVKTDFETILQRFSASGTVRYEKFAEIWREMKFSMYCAGRLSNHEAKEFVEECFNIAVQFWLPPSSFLVRAGALYLLYGLYNCQYVAPKVKIRLTQEQWEQVSKFHSEARQQQHLDLDFIFQKMLVQKAFSFVATTTEFFPSLRDRDDSHYIPEILKEESGVVDDIFSSSAVGQLEMVHEQYQKMKIALNEEGGSKPDSSLDIIHSDLINGIQKVLSNHRLRLKSSRQTVEINSIAEEEADTIDPTVHGEKGTSVKKSIKSKAYRASTSYFKSKKGQGSSEDTAAESTDTDMKSPNNLQNVKGKGGRQKVQVLYEKDDIDWDEITEADLGEMYSMPDLDIIALPRIHKPEDSESTAEEEGKGKTPLKGKNKLKSQKRSTTSTESDLSDVSPEKKVKEETLSDISYSSSDEEKTSKHCVKSGKVTVVPKPQVEKQSAPDTKSKKKKTLVKSVKKIKAVGKVKKNTLEDDSESPKKPSAQDLLNKTIKERNKKQRIKKMNRKNSN